MTEFKDKNGNIIKKCPTPIGHSIDKNGHLVNQRCKSWKCPYCSQINKKRLLDRISNGFANSSYVVGFTLTAPKDYSQKEFIKSWHVIKQSIQNRYGRLRYFRMTEFSDESHLYYNKKMKKWNWSVGNQRHYHILINIKIPWRDLLFWWEKATKDVAHRIYISKYNIKSSAGYISKYVTKSCRNEQFNKNESRYSHMREGHYEYSKTKPLIFKGYCILSSKKKTWVRDTGGFNFTDIEKQIRYNFRYPQKGEWTFRLGRPVPKMELTGVRPIIPDEEIVDVSKRWNYACFTTLHCSKEDLAQMKKWYPEYRWETY